MQQYLLSFLIFTPLVAAFFILFLPFSQQKHSRTITVFASILQCLTLFYILFQFSGDGSLQMIEKKPWITLDLGSWGILKAEYFVALDGLNLPLVALTVVIMLIATIASWNVDKSIKGYFA